MFKQTYALARQLLTLMQDVQKLKAEHKEFRQDLRALIDIVRQLKYEQQRDRENATHEQEKLLLRLENALLRFERRLPSPGSTAAGSVDSVLPESRAGSSGPQQAARPLRNPCSSQLTLRHAGECGEW